jgi:hypothetical protein
MPIIKIESSMRKGANVCFRINTKIRNFFAFPVTSIYDIPIIINNFNRLTYLKLQINWLVNAGYKNIYIIDNNSSYEPLLDFYETLPFTIFKLDQNIGHFSLWETVIYMKFKNSYYVYTDPDILPIEQCPNDFLNYFKKVLDEFPLIKKVGFGLKIDDLPTHYHLSEKVIKWEKQFWMNNIKDGLYDALIDTTFALYKPGAKGGADGPAIRTSDKYIARHLPWYEDSNNLDDETRFYISSTSQVSSWYKSLNGSNQQYD